MASLAGRLCLGPHGNHGGPCYEGPVGPWQPRSGAMLNYFAQHALRKVSEWYMRTQEFLRVGTTPISPLASRAHCSEPGARLQERGEPHH